TEITHTTVRTGSLGAAAGERVARAGGLAHRKKGRWKHACCLYEDEDKLEDEEEEEEEEEAARSKRELSAPRVGSSSRPPELLASWCSGRGARQASCCHRPPRWAVVPSIAASDNRRGGGKEGGGRPGGVRGGRRTERGGTKGDASSSAARSALVKRPSFKTKRGSRRRAPGPRQRGRAVRRAPAARSSLCSAQRPAEAQHWEEAPRQLQQGYWPLAEGTAARTKGQSHFPGAGSGRSAIGAEYAGQNQS
ncbi:unnamed protein product, partial [Prorocentrum cordatum]